MEFVHKEIVDYMEKKQNCQYNDSTQHRKSCHKTVEIKVWGGYHACRGKVDE